MNYREALKGCPPRNDDKPGVLRFDAVIHCAFTLAEVLITIGIIGVVVAMTLPVLIQNNRKQVTVTRLQKFYTNINQAVKMSEIDHGDKKEWATLNCNGIACTEWFNEYIGKYMQITDVRKIDNANIGVYFPDGSMVVVKQGYDFFFYPEAKKYNMDGFSRPTEDGSIVREHNGKYFFSFQFTPQLNDATHQEHYNKGVEPYKALYSETITNPDGSTSSVPIQVVSREDFMNTPGFGCNKTSNYKAYCTALIQYDGWKIADDYPIKF